MNQNEQIYHVLKRIQDGPEPTAEEVGLGHEGWLTLLGHILDERYARMTAIRGGREHRPRIVWLEGATLTEKGEAFLRENGPKD